MYCLLRVVLQWFSGIDFSFVNPFSSQSSSNSSSSSSSLISSSSSSNNYNNNLCKAHIFLIYSMY